MPGKFWLGASEYGEESTFCYKEEPGLPGLLGAVPGLI